MVNVQPNVQLSSLPETPAPAAVKSRALHILLAEDNPINQKLAVTLLMREGHRVTVAEDGVVALRLLTQDRFDLILMDMQMPGLSGIEATGQIRALERVVGGDVARAALPGGVTRIPIVALTANAYAEDREACLAAGMDGFVSKPIRREELLAAIAGALAEG